MFLFSDYANILMLASGLVSTANEVYQLFCLFCFILDLSAASQYLTTETWIGYKNSSKMV